MSSIGGSRSSVEINYLLFSFVVSTEQVHCWGKVVQVSRLPREREFGQGSWRADAVGDGVQQRGLVVGRWWL